MKLLLILYFVALSSGCKSERKTQPINVANKNINLEIIVAQIAEENVIGDNIGIAGSPYRFKLYQNLNKNATNEDLVFLTDNKAPSVRYYAFRALCYRKNPLVFDLLVKHINDTARLTSFNGCSGIKETLIYNLLNVVKSKYIEPTGYRLTSAQEKVIDSLLKIYPDPVYNEISAEN